VSEEEVLEEDRVHRSGNTLISPQSLVLIAALLSLGGIVWYFLQPPSADALYSRIHAIAEENRPERLADASNDIKRFLSYYPADHRGRELQRYLDDIDLYRLEVRYRRGARQARDAELYTPLERAYAEALRLVDVDPDRGEQKLRALQDLYGSEPDLSEREQQCLKLALRHLEKLGVKGGELDDDLRRLEQRLTAADAEPDRAAAAKIYRALIDLYGDKLWARPVVDAAEAKLRESPPAPGRTEQDSQPAADKAEPSASPDKPASESTPSAPAEKPAP
jgi:hypothetical protein